MKKMVFIRIIITILLTCISSSVFAVDGYFVGKNIVYPAWNSSVRLLHANIEIEANDGEWDVDCKALYQNTGKTKTFQFGFPRPASTKNGIKIREFKTYVSKKIRKKSLKRARANSKIKGMSYGKVYTSWIKLNSGSKRYIRHTYTINMKKDSSGLSTLTYILKPAKLWKGKVNKLSINIKDVDTDFICSVMPKGYEIGANNVKWMITNTNPNQDIRIIWHYEIRDWVDGSKQLLEGAANPGAIEEKLSEGKDCIDRCFLSEDTKGTYALLRKNEKAKEITADLFNRLINKHPAENDLVKFFNYRKYIYKFSGNKKQLSGMYREFLNNVKEKKIQATVEELEEIAKDSSKYLENNELALLSYQLIFKLHKKTIKKEKIPQLLCKLAGSYADNKSYKEAINTYSSISKYSEDKKDTEWVVKKFVKMVHGKALGKIDNKLYRKSNKRILKLCNKHAGLNKYEFGAMLRIADSYKKENKFRSAVKVYENINKSKSFKQAMKDKYVKKQLAAAREKSKTETDPLFIRIIKAFLFLVLLFIMISASETINKVYRVMGLVYRKLDDALYFIWSKIRPVVSLLLKPFVSITKNLSGGIIEFVEDKMPVPLMKFTGGIISAVWAVIKTFFNNLAIAIRVISQFIGRIINLAPQDTRKKVRTLLPVPDKDYFIHIFSIFRKNKEKTQRVSGELKRDMKWKGAVTVTGDVIISKGKTLTLRPGTTVAFNADSCDNDAAIEHNGKLISNNGKCDIIVYGKLLAEGREGAPVVIGKEGWGSIIFMGKAKGSVINLCEVSGAVDAIKCYDSSTPGIKNSIIENNTGFAIKISDDSAPIIDSNRIANNGAGGILCENSSSARITSNAINNNNAVGINCIDSSSPKIISNNVSKGNLVAIECGGSSTPKITKNNIQESKNCGIISRDNSKPGIKDNNIGNNGIGVTCLNSSEPSVENNRIRGSKLAINCQDASKPVVRGNTLTGNNNGIDLETSTELTITSNKINNSIDSGIICRDSIKHIIKENSFEKNNSGITCFDDNSSLLSNNKFKENKAGLTCKNSSKPTFEKNSIEDNYYGIVCLESSSPVINENAIKNSKNTGIKFINHSTPEITLNNIEKNEVALMMGSLTGANIDGSNVFKDNKKREEAFEEEGVPVSRTAPTLTASSTESPGTPGQVVLESAIDSAPGGDPVEEIKTIEGVSMNEETIEGGKKTVITVLEEAIKFDLVEETFSDESLPNLERIGEAIKSFEKHNIEINVHTDNTGNPTYNMQLSGNIGKSIKEYLVNVKKLEAERIKHEGFGGQKPVATNDSVEGRHNNRRVEFILTKQA